MSSVTREADAAGAANGASPGTGDAPLGVTPDGRPIVIEFEHVSKWFRGTRRGNAIPLPLPGFLQRRLDERQRRRGDDYSIDDDLDEEDEEEDDDDDDEDEEIPEGEEVWALKDINLRVPAGITLGLIGSNASGKSTLIKILAGMTQVTEGRVAIRGRVTPLMASASRLIQSDLSGRDNIYFVAEMLGVHREEATGAIERIAKFAELDDRIDDPVRTYSDGYAKRLAVSTSLMLEPDILLSDEDPHVGDIHFREKCRVWLEERARSGLTMVMVSHDMEQVRRTCDEVIWLDEGKIVEQGDPEPVTLKFERKAPARRTASHATITGTGLFAGDGEPASEFRVDEDVTFEARVRARDAGTTFSPTVLVIRDDETVVRTSPPDPIELEERGDYVLRVRLPANLLDEGEYKVRIRASVLQGRERVGIERLDTDVFHLRGAPEGYAPAMGRPDEEGKIRAKADLDWSATYERAEAI